MAAPSTRDGERSRLTVECNSCGERVVVSRSTVHVKDGFEIVRCPHCGLVFRATRPDRDELGEIYDDSYFSASAGGDLGGTGYLDYLEDEPLHRLNARRRLRELHEHISPGRLLDVGCAAGFFLDEARRAGWDGHGVELAGNMAAYASTQLALPVANTSFLEATLTDATLDAVTMWDYIEHSADPAADFRRARRLLVPGGVIAISTGDVSSLVARVSGPRWHLLTPRHHLFYFEPKTIRCMLEQTGFDVLSVAHPSQSYSLRYVTHKLRTLANLDAVRRAAERLQASRVGRIPVPINLGDIMVVVARAR